MVWCRLRVLSVIGVVELCAMPDCVGVRVAGRKACKRCVRRVAEARARAEGRRKTKPKDEVLSRLSLDSPLLEKQAFDDWFRLQ